MEFFGYLPGSPSNRSLRLARQWHEIIAPIGETLLLQPQRVVLTDEVLIAVHPAKLDVLEAVPRTVEATPEIEIANRLRGLKRGLVGSTSEWLEMRLADQGRAVPLGLECIANSRHVFRQLYPDRPAAVGGGILPGNDRGAGWRTDRVWAIGAVELDALGGEAIEVRGPDPGIVAAKREPMLLVAGDEQDIGLGVSQGRPHVVAARIRSMPPPYPMMDNGATVTSSGQWSAA
jgi:hypothetical protein